MVLFAICGFMWYAKLRKSFSLGGSLSEFCKSDHTRRRKGQPVKLGSSRHPEGAQACERTADFGLCTGRPVLSSCSRRNHCCRVHARAGSTPVSHVSVRIPGKSERNWRCCEMRCQALGWIQRFHSRLLWGYASA